LKVKSNPVENDINKNLFEQENLLHDILDVKYESIVDKNLIQKSYFSNQIINPISSANNNDNNLFLIKNSKKQLKKEQEVFIKPSTPNLQIQENINNTKFGMDDLMNLKRKLPENLQSKLKNEKKSKHNKKMEEISMFFPKDKVNKINEDSNF